MPIWIGRRPAADRVIQDSREPHSEAMSAAHARGMTAETLTAPDAVTPCSTCSRYTCRCGEVEERWPDVASSLAPWSQAIAANA